MNTAALTCIVVALLAAPAHAFTYAGTGTASCGEWTSERRNPYGGAGQQWVLGFLAGAADYGGPDAFDGTDAEGVWAWIDRYCWQNPTDKLLTAAEAFVRARRR